ncbi:MAG: UvrD-helicase domain-containing protein [Clostridia bacterium]|nr:UvrD-helicase domain-containing protein [Clostridia bacterium]
MNDMQFEAMVTSKGPVLILAGAGSGKTTVLVNRIAYLIKYGNAYMSDYTPDLSANEVEQIKDYLSGKIKTAPLIPALKIDAPEPWQILAITFTNKAAGELKERLVNFLGQDGNDIWAGTFHSTCAKILRRFGDRIDYSSHFTIYDTDDAKRVIKDCQKRLNIDDKLLSHRSIMNEISRAKDSLIDPKEYLASAGSDFRKKQIAEVYSMYQRTLQSNDAMDFDDLIANTVRLFEENEEVISFYRNRFRYVMVDEYQDTNHAQYMFVKLLAQEHRNICVVGDDDQSIYRFRGATIENILSFESEYKNAKTIRLEQNYRSTTHILNAANGVIAHNMGRKGKNLWTDNGEGDKITIHTSRNEHEEAKFVADKVLEQVSYGGKFSDSAVLYRMNAQSNAIENAFMRSGIPYKVIGGFRFYERKEIKDVMSYLSFINNSNDDLRLRRIINEPKRGIGDTTVNTVSEIANVLGVSMFEVLKTADRYEKLSRVAPKLMEFANKMQQLIDLSQEVSVHELLELTLDKSGYLAALKAEGEEGEDRVNNVNELSSSILTYEQEAEDPSLSEFLEQVALITDIDSLDENADRVVMMTLHSAKGLEFNTVFLVGMEDGIFPGNQSIYAGPEEMEEERRLAYVGITRAKKKLYLVNSIQRMLFGTTGHNRPSRFISEIPGGCVIEDMPEIPRSTFGGTVPAYKPTSAVTQFKNMSKTVSKPTQTVSSATYKSGDRVVHKTFGEGMVLNATEMGNDYLLEIAFDVAGTKKIMANFAGIKKAD